jgi:hypothetical protein
VDSGQFHPLRDLRVLQDALEGWDEFTEILVEILFERAGNIRNNSTSNFASIFVLFWRHERLLDEMSKALEIDFFTSSYTKTLICDQSIFCHSVVLIEKIGQQLDNLVLKFKTNLWTNFDENDL